MRSLKVAFCIAVSLELLTYHTVAKADEDWLQFGQLFDSSSKKDPRQESCTNIDFSAELGSVRNQGNSDWCFAEVDADLIGHKMKLKPPEKVSMLDVASAYYNATREDILNKGAPGDKDDDLIKSRAVESADFLVREKVRERFSDKSLGQRGLGMPFLAATIYRTRGGACLESRVPTESLRSDADFIFNSIREMEAKRGMHVANLPRDPGPHKLVVGGSKVDPWKFSSLFEFTTSSRAEADLEIYPKLEGGSACPPFNNRWTPTIKRLVASLNDKASREVDAEINARCGARIPLPKYVEVSKAVPLGRGEELIPDIDKVLSNRQPIGIEYNMRFLNERKSVDNFFEPFGLPRSNHASILVGRRWNKKAGKCEYKLRNSWGPHCSGYVDRLKKTCKDGDGHIWIEEEDLKKNLWRTTWLK